MKKQLILCGLAAASILAYASSEKIALTHNGTQVGTIRVEKLNEITYSGDDKGFNTINFNMQDGSVKSFSLDDFTRMEYSAPLPENPVQVEVIPHHTCATLTITSPEGIYYRIVGKPEDELKNIDEDDWADYLIQCDKDYVQSVAEEWGRPLSTFPISQVCETGSQLRDWYPDNLILDNTPIALVLYTAEIENNDLAVTSEPRLLRFTTKEYVIEEVELTVSADMTSNAVTVKADGVPDNISFSIELYSKAEIEENNILDLMKNSANQYATMIYQYGANWSDFCFMGHGERTWTNKAIGEEFVAVAFGCEYGVITTYPTTLDIVIPEPEITDDCTFDVETVQLTPGEISLKITPSNNETRYTAFLVSGDRLSSTTPSQYIGSQIKWYNNTNTIRWSEDKYVYTGEKTITTHEGIINGEYLQAEQEYFVLICGITPDGTRTTDIKQVQCITSIEDDKEPVTFDVQFGKRTPTGSYATQIITVTPSDKEARYVFDHLPASNAYADLSVDDEEFITRYLEVQGKYLKLHTGDEDINISYQKEWSYENNSYEWEKHIVIIFSYDGVVTSPLYIYELDTSTGKAKQLRGPGIESETEQK